jgi:hypothetical protein
MTTSQTRFRYPVPYWPELEAKVVRITCKSDSVCIYARVGFVPGRSDRERGSYFACVYNQVSQSSLHLLWDDEEYQLSIPVSAHTFSEALRLCPEVFAGTFID